VSGQRNRQGRATPTARNPSPVGTCAACGELRKIKSRGLCWPCWRECRASPKWRSGNELRPLRERLFAKLVFDQSGCLLWTGKKDSGGYGRTRIGGKGSEGRAVHILVWEMYEGPVPPGLQLDHVASRGCRNRHCASIAHLEPVTSAENTRRGRSGPREFCHRGHRFDEGNIVYGSRGKRECRKCRLARQRVNSRNFRARRRAAELAEAAQ